VHASNVHVHGVLVPAENEAAQEPHFADLEFSAGSQASSSEPSGALEEERSC
jgi:hypothetical protein